jgi:hypothetical protein
MAQTGQRSVQMERRYIRDGRIAALLLAVICSNPTAAPWLERVALATLRAGRMLRPKRPRMSRLVFHNTLGRPAYAGGCHAATSANRVRGPVPQFGAADDDGRGKQ